MEIRTVLYVRQEVTFFLSDDKKLHGDSNCVKFPLKPSYITNKLKLKSVNLKLKSIVNKLVNYNISW